MMPSNQEEDLKKIGETVAKMKTDLDSLHEALAEIKQSNDEIIKVLKLVESK